MKAWKWWQGGIALGLLSALSMILVKPMGTSTAYSSTVGMLLKPIAPNFVAQNEYLQTVPLSIGWEHMLVLGIPLGAFLAYRLMRKSGAGPSPYGGSSASSPLLAFVGGFLVLFGARMASGCTTGHILSGMSQLAVSGFIFAGALFAAGIPTALLVRRRLH